MDCLIWRQESKNICSWFSLIISTSTGQFGEDGGEDEDGEEDGEDGEDEDGKDGETR